MQKNYFVKFSFMFAILSFNFANSTQIDLKKA